MNKAQKAHMAEIISAQANKIMKKYPKGQREHKGNIWEKPGMLNNADEEVTDLITYLHVIRQQIELAINFLKKGRLAFALTILENLIGREEDYDRKSLRNIPTK